MGPGVLKHAELEELTKEIDSGKRKFPFVAEVEFREQHEDSFKLEHPVFQRIRDDKKVEECLYEE